MKWIVQGHPRISANGSQAQSRIYETYYFDNKIFKNHILWFLLWVLNRHSGFWMWIQFPEFEQMLSNSGSGIYTTGHLQQRPWKGPIALLLSPPPTAVTAPGPAGTGTQQSDASTTQKDQTCLNIKEEVSFFNQPSPLMQGQEGRSDKMRDSWQANTAGAQQGSGQCRDLFWKGKML